MTNGNNGDHLPSPKFPFGRIVTTPGVLEKLDRPKIAALLRRHGELDRGTLSSEDVDVIFLAAAVDGVLDVARPGSQKEESDRSTLA